MNYNCLRILSFTATKTTTVHGRQLTASCRRKRGNKEGDCVEKVIGLRKCNYHLKNIFFPASFSPR